MHYELTVAYPVADPNVELRRGWGRSGSGLDLLALLAFFPSAICYYFNQNRGRVGRPPGPIPRSAFATNYSACFILTSHNIT